MNSSAYNPTLHVGWGCILNYAILQVGWGCVVY